MIGGGFVTMLAGGGEGVGAQYMRVSPCTEGGKGRPCGGVCADGSSRGGVGGTPGRRAGVLARIPVNMPQAWGGAGSGGREEEQLGGGVW